VLYVLCAACSDHQLTSQSGSSPEAKRACCRLATWLWWTGAERGEAREQLWLGRSDGAEPGSCWLFSEYTGFVCVQGGREGAMLSYTTAYLHYKSWLNNSADHRRKHQALLSTGWIRMRERWAKECRDEGTKRKESKFVDGWVTGIKQLTLKGPHHFVVSIYFWIWQKSVCSLKAE